MQITVTNTSSRLTTLLSASNLLLAENNREGSKGYNVTFYNADSTSTDIVYLTYGETATASEGLPLLAPASATAAGDFSFIQVGDLSKINLISNVASTTVNVLITPIFC